MLHGPWSVCLCVCLCVCVCLSVCKLCFMKKIPDVFSCNSNTRRCFLKQFWQESFRLKQRPLRDSNPILQQSSTPVGLSAREKNGVVQTGSSFGSQGHPKSLRMVPFDRRQNFLYFPFSRPCAQDHVSGVVLEFRRKKRNSRKRKLIAMAASLENSKIEVRVVHLQPCPNRTVKTA